MKMTLKELLGLAALIVDTEIPEHCEPEKVTVVLGRLETGELTADLSGKEWRD